MPSFNLDAARNAGYSDDVIAAGLAKEQGVNYSAAIKAGYTASDMLPSLVKEYAPKQGIVDRAIDTGKDIGNSMLGTVVGGGRAVLDTWDKIAGGMAHMAGDDVSAEMARNNIEQRHASTDLSDISDYQPKTFPGEVLGAVAGMPSSMVSSAPQVLSKRLEEGHSLADAYIHEGIDLGKNLALGYVLQSGLPVGNALTKALGGTAGEAMATIPAIARGAASSAADMATFGAASRATDIDLAAVDGEDVSGKTAFAPGGVFDPHGMAVDAAFGSVMHTADPIARKIAGRFRADSPAEIKISDGDTENSNSDDGAAADLNAKESAYQSPILRISKGTDQNANADDAMAEQLNAEQSPVDVLNAIRPAPEYVETAPRPTLEQELDEISNPKIIPVTPDEKVVNANSADEAIESASTALDVPVTIDPSISQEAALADQKRAALQAEIAKLNSSKTGIDNGATVPDVSQRLDTPRVEDAGNIPQRSNTDIFSGDDSGRDELGGAGVNLPRTLGVSDRTVDPAGRGVQDNAVSGSPAQTDLQHDLNQRIAEIKYRSSIGASTDINTREANAVASDAKTKGHITEQEAQGYYSAIRNAAKQSENDAAPPAENDAAPPDVVSPPKKVIDFEVEKQKLANASDSDLTKYLTLSKAMGDKGRPLYELAVAEKANRATQATLSTDSMPAQQQAITQESPAAKLSANTSLPPDGYAQAKKQPDGSYRLNFIGTGNEIFPGEKFSSANEARQYLKVMREKQVTIPATPIPETVTRTPAISPTPMSDTSANPLKSKKPKTTVDPERHTLLQAVAIIGVDPNDPLANDLRRSIGLKDGENKRVSINGELPQWLFRKNGQRIDTIAGDLSQQGQKYLDAHDRQELLNKLFDNPDHRTPEGEVLAAQHDRETELAEQEATNKERIESSLAAQNEASTIAELEWIVEHGGDIMSAEEADAFNLQFQEAQDAEYSATQTAARNDTGKQEADSPARAQEDQSQAGEGFSLAGETEAEIAAKKKAEHDAEMADIQAARAESRQQAQEDEAQTAKNNVQSGAAADAFSLSQPEPVSKSQQKRLDAQKARDELNGQTDMLGQSTQPAKVSNKVSAKEAIGQGDMLNNGPQLGDMVKLTKPNPNGGKPINISGKVVGIKPDGKLDIKTQQDGYVQRAISELGHITHEQYASSTQPANVSTNIETGDTSQAEEVHSGYVIKPIKVRSQGEVVDRWNLQSESNRAIAESGGRESMGDRLFNSKEEAMAGAAEQKERVEKDRVYSEQRNAEDAKLKAMIEANRGLTITERKANATLDKQHGFKGQSMSLRDIVKTLVNEGAELTTEEVNKIKDMSRREFNRADNREQAAHEQKVREGGKKNVYYVGDYDLGKTAYDYAMSLKNGDKLDVTESNFGNTAEPKSEADKAKAHMTAAGVTGNDMIQTLAAVRRGEVTADEVAEAHGVEAKPAQEAKSEEAKPQSISDFGENLEGAKKDLWKSYKKAMTDELPADAKDITLSKHFPEPDYENLIASGLDIRSVAAIKAMRDEIPSKPRVSYRLKTWATKVKMLRDFSAKIIDGNGSYNIDNVLTKMRENNLSGFADRIQLYAELGYPAFKAAKGYEISGGWSAFNRDGSPKENSQYGLKDSQGRVSFFATREDALDALRAKLETAPEETGRSIKLDLYKVTSTGDIVIGKKVASHKYIDLKGGFKTAREAREYLAEHEGDLLELLKQKKDVKPTRRSVNNPRVGEDYRMGEDVTPEKFAAEYGFRGVQFGNYVEQGRRAKDLNNAYDALLDMAHILNIPPRAISLNGSLGLAFGARGSGGVEPAAAHYEPDNVVINLTKINGAGSLGHEWFHAMDNYFSKARGDAHGFLSGKPYERGDGVRTEVTAAFHEVTKAIRESEFYKNSLSLDTRKSKDYWSTQHELSARAFEAYLIAKAEAKGESNDYLANIISEDAHNASNEIARDVGMNEDPYAYPTKAEQEVINPLFDKLFSTLKTKETDQGTALYSRNDQPVVNPHTTTSLQPALINAFTGKLRNAVSALFDAGKARVVTAEQAAMVIGKDALFMTAWHGSPHDHDKFDSSKIGTGEGAQAYGHGLYFASNREVAEWYRNNLNSQWVIDGEPLRGVIGISQLAKSSIELSASLDDAILYLKSDTNLGSDTVNGRNLARAIDWIEKNRGRIKKTGAIYQVELAPKEDEYLDFDLPISRLTGAAKAAIFEGSPDSIPGYAKFFGDLIESQAFVSKGFSGLDVPTQNRVLEQVSRASQKDEVFKSIVELIPVDVMNILTERNNRPADVLLHNEAMLKDLFSSTVDHPISMRSNRAATSLIRATAQSIAKNIDAARLSSAPDGGTTKTTSDSIHIPIVASLGQNATGGEFYKALSGKLGSEKAASEYLHSIGIRGIRYLDGSSRSAGEGSHNYVIFDDKDVSITAKFSRDNIKYGETGNALAFFNPKDGITYFIADHLSKDTTSQELRGLALHEIAVHALKLGRDSAEFQSILKLVDNMRKAGNKQVKAAFDRVPSDTAAKDVNEEVLAYLVQESPDLSISQKLIAWLRSAIRSIGKSLPVIQRMKFMDGINELTPEDLTYMAHDALAKSTTDTMGEYSGDGVMASKQRHNNGNFKSREANQEEEKPSVLAKSLPEKIKQLSSEITKRFQDSDMKRNLYMMLIPMSEGSMDAKASAQKFMNDHRLAQSQWHRMDEYLTSKFTKSQREEMYNAADEQNVLMRQGLPTEGKGLDRLNPDQRAVMEMMHNYAKELWKRAVDIGMVEGEGMPFWTPRMAVMIGDEGTFERPVAGGKKTSSNGEGRNITTTASSLKHAKYMFAEDTEAGMKGALGENAALVRDIRTMPLAMARLESAIAGRELVNQIKAIGKVSGKDLISESKQPNFVTIDHPAFTTYKPRVLSDKGGIPILDDNGKIQMAKDQEGNMIFDAQPLFISKSWEGPLKAIMSTKDGEIYRAYMLIKSKAMTAIMVSPLTHNMVIAGRAMAYDPLAVLSLKAYLSGNALAKDASIMNRAISAGMVPMGANRSSMVDITDIARGIGREGSWGDPNESWVNLAAQKIGNALKDGAGDTIKEKMDSIGDYWHHDMLWKQVGALQMYIFNDYSNYLVSKGHPQAAADAIAAHLANRYGGAVARENQSEMMRKFLNVVLFSRSFNVGNVGAVKDTAFGMPAGLVAKLYHDVGKEAGDLAMQAARGKARMSLAADLGMSMILTSATSAAISYLLQNQSADDIKSGYVRRLGAMFGNIKEHPLNPKSYNPYQVLPTWDNEEGKQDRIDVGADEMGRHSYLRLPTGKVVEDTIGWLLHFPDTFNKKLSPVAKSSWQALTNDKGYGVPVSDPSGNWITNIGQGLVHVLKAQTPYDTIQTMVDVASGHGTPLDTKKLAGFATGFSISQGNIHGPEAAEAMSVEDRLKAEKAYVMQDVKKYLKYGDVDSAIDKLEKIGFTRKEITLIIRNIESPIQGMSKSQAKKFNAHANDDERNRMDNFGSAPRP